MSFINPALLYGLGLALAPVLLHLLMKSKPKKLLFPALQLIQKRRMQNTRRLRLRHLWLLLLRVLVLGILITALTRPSLPPAEYSPSLREWLTMLAIGGCLILVYFSLLRWWKRKLVPNHVLNSRRTFLRGGLGVLAAALIALLVAWPYQKRIAAEISKPLPEVSSDLPVAAVFLFDTSRSMDYRLKGKTRLEMAREIATEHLAALPSRSQVAVGDTSSSADFPFQVDLAAAQSRIESLKTKAASSPLNQGLRTALALHEDDRRRTLAAQGDVPIDARADQLVREIYIFTDRAASAWQASAGPFLTQELERLDWVGVYLIDVGVESHQNAALTNLVLPEQSVAEGEDVFITADVSAQGYDGRKVTVEFYADGENGQSVKQDQRNVTLTESSSQLVEFAMRSARPGITQGEVRLASGDPFKADDRLRFSVISRPGARVLVIAEAESAEANEDLEQRLLAGVKSDAGALIEILTLLNFECDFMRPEEIVRKEIAPFDVIALVNVARPDLIAWEKVAAWVQSGGGLAVFLGSARFGGSDGISPEAYNTEVAQSVLPVRLRAWRKFLPEPTGLDLRQTTHPVLRKFDVAGAATDVGLIPVRWAWNVAPLKQASVVLRFSDRDQLPALIEKTYGEGRTLVCTTGFTARTDRRNEWSGLSRHWAFLVLTDQMMHYLSGRSRAVVNYEAGSDVLVPLDRRDPLRRYLLRKPGGIQLPGDIPAGTSLLRLTEIDEVGHYELVSANADQKFQSGFSVNLPVSESDFSRLSEIDLDLLLGPDRYAIAENTDSLNRTVNTGRLGVEVFPLILGLVLLVFCLELIVSNRFYESDQEVLPESSTASI